MNSSPIDILLIEDDEDDFVIIRNLLERIQAQTFRLDWVSTYEDAWEKMETESYGVILLDYRLGEHNGLEFLRNAVTEGCGTPIIFLTGYGTYELDVEAMRAGATDYLTKAELTSPLLERAIRYAIARSRTERALRESEGKLRCLSSSLMSVQEDERRRISRELHDELGQSLSLLKLHIRAIEKKLNADQETVAAECRDVRGFIDQVIENVRRLSRDLSPSILVDLGLSATLRWMAQEFAKQSGIRVYVDGPEIDDCFSASSQMIIYRLFQEIFTNIERHSDARSVRVEIKRCPSGLTFVVEDDGAGFEQRGFSLPGKEKKGLGLTIMDERVRMLGGTIDVFSGKGKGTRIRFQLPREAVKEEEIPVDGL